MGLDKEAGKYHVRDRLNEMMIVWPPTPTPSSPRLMLLALVWGLFLTGLTTELRTHSPKVYFSPLKQIFRKYRLVSVYFLLSLVVIYLVSLIGLFPEEIVEVTAEGRIITGIHTHFAGLAFGFLVSYVFIRNEFRRKRK